MSERVYHNTHPRRGEWPDGPWTDEPDKVQFTTEAGLPGLVVRGPMGALCGYVGMPPGHLLHGVDYDEVKLLGEYPDVHGGLTFADSCQPGPEDISVCHVPEPGEPDNVWWLGFDCGHSGDVIPGMVLHNADFARRHPELFRGGPRDMETYRELAYVRAETERLAAQLVCAVAAQ